MRHCYTRARIGASGVTQLILVRHGEPRAARATADDGLTDLGRRQAIALGPPLRSLAPDVVLVSPTPRAIETAELAGVRFRLDDAFEKFRYGAGEVRERGDGPDMWRPSDRFAADGESLGEFHERVAAGLANLLAGSPKTAVVIAHGGIISRCTGTYVLSNGARRFTRSMSSSPIPIARCTRG
jgi:broad specificity phosphatase PhoE